MADDDFTPPTETPTEASAQPPADGGSASDTGEGAPAKKAAKKAPAKKATKKAAAKKTAAKKTAKKAAAKPDEGADEAPAKKTTAKKTASMKADKPAADEAADQGPGTMLLFKAPEPTTVTSRPARTRKVAAPEAAEAGESESGDEPVAKAPAKKAAAKKTAAKKTAKKAVAKPDDTEAEDEESSAESADGDDFAEGGEGGSRRRRRRGGRRRRKPGDAEGGGDDNESGPSDSGDGDSGDGDGEGTSRRRRRRTREGDDRSGGGDDPQNTVTRVRKPRSAEDEITAIAGSTRLEAKKQRRREGREAGRRRAPIVSEAEFLARRESVDRVMVIRQRDDLTQIGVLEDKVLVEHYVARESQTSLIGNVYLGRVQNVLPSMEAAFIDIGKGRNAVLYAGEVNWSALGHKDGAPRKIESVLSSGQTILVQVTKDPVGHKGARLTSQVSLAGRFLVYVPDGTTSGISRKLPDTERNRLKSLLKEIVPDTAGVIVRTAAEGASEEELTRDVERLKARWEDIEAKTKGQSPKLLYGEPDLTLKVVRDLFTEDFARLVIQGDDAWESVTEYVRSVAPDLEGRLEKYDGGQNDIFSAFRVDEQIAKALDRKVWLPSGGSLIIDRTEAMTVVDVNTGKFTGSGGNLEETVTKNNLEAAEEVVRQLRLRDIGGIIVIDFIDMVLESNRDLVLRRMVECLGRDRTRHQVAEVTSLGLVQMTRKRIGTGLLEAFSENCPHCQGRGLTLHDMPVEAKGGDDDQRRGGGRRRGGRGQGQEDDNGSKAVKHTAPSPKVIAAMAKAQHTEPADADADLPDEVVAEQAEAPAATDAPETPAASEAPEQSDQTDDEAAPAEVVVTKRTRKSTRAKTPKAKPAEEPAEALFSEPEAEPEPVAETEPEPVPEEVAAPGATTKVVTRTRRSASRPAGTPVRTAEPAAPIQVPAASDGAGVDGDAAANAPIEPPKVVTRTRGRSASRAAGPPVLVASDGTAAEGDAPVVEHVPIKKKGTRKR